MLTHFMLQFDACYETSQYYHISCYYLQAQVTWINLSTQPCMSVDVDPVFIYPPVTS